MSATGTIETTTDAFLGGALMLRQPKQGYRAGIDPVLLAASCPANAGDRVLDCGAGVGTVGLCVARRVAGAKVVLVEREPAYASLARDNLRSNGLADAVTLIEADITRPLAQTPALSAAKGTFDHALANPPYQIDADGTRSADVLKDAANAMPEDGLEMWARFLAAMVKPGGTVTFIHRADALPALFAALDRRFGGLVVRLLHPHDGAAANRVLIRGIKGSRAPLTIVAPLVVHLPGGNYTAPVAAALKTGADLPMPG